MQAQGQVDSLIPLLYIEHDHNAQAATNAATVLLKAAVTRFEAAADTLLESNAKNSVLPDIISFIDSCRYACTANLEWR